MSKVGVLFIKFYRIFLSPLFPAQCRFYPSCSHYAEDAIRKYGFLKGAILSVGRILRCNPFSAGGYDPLR
ncbi:MAG TPA: membrane protein insertion efficiency factor YidD [bacterium]